MLGQPASFIIVVMIDDDVVCVKTKNAVSFSVVLKSNIWVGKYHTIN